MRLFYTGATEYLGEQKSPRLSLGGFISSSPLPNDILNGIFGSISDYKAVNGLKEVRGVVLRNETGGDATPSIWYKNNSSDPITNIRMSIVSVAVDNCGNFYIESIQNEQASPVSASFTDNRGEDNKITMPTIPDDGYVGIWIERRINANAVKNALSCDNLYAKHISAPLPETLTIQSVADSSSSLNSKYWNLNTKNESFYIWYDVDGAGVNPQIAGREGIRVSVSANDTAETVAGNTNSKLNEILVPRGEFTTSILTDTITLTMSENGPLEDSTAENSGFTINVTQEGVDNSLELVEDIDIFISY